LPFGNFDYTINIVNDIYNRGQAILMGDTEVQKIEYISDNEKSESVIYVS
jgi:preprotein translocase subunit SecA